MAKKKKQPWKPNYQYKTSEMEAKYRIFMNRPSQEVFEEKLAKVKANNGRCLCNINTPLCMCNEFLERDSEGFCECGIYYKEARTAAQAQKYLESTFEVDEKREKELEREAKKAEKAAEEADE